MKTTQLLNFMFRRPSPFIRAFHYSKMTEPKPPISLEDTQMVTLLPNNQDHFETFTKIVTNENIAFTFSWIDKWFGVKALRRECNHTETKLKLISEGDRDVKLPREVMEDYESGISPTQVTLNRLFSEPTNKEKLKEIYLEMTGMAEETGLGYYKFEDKEKKLLGGGALAPISKDMPISKVDIALHILIPKQGIGTFFLNKLLIKAFEEYGVKQVWGSSIVNHPKTPTLCTRHGMMIRDYDGMKYYFIDDKMWETNRDRKQIMEHPIAASTYYDKSNNRARM